MKHCFYGVEGFNFKDNTLFVITHVPLDRPGLVKLMSFSFHYFALGDNLINDIGPSKIALLP